MLKLFALLLLCPFAFTSGSEAAGDGPAQPAAIQAAVDEVIPPLMRKENIPGMAVAVVIGGKSLCFSYGVASRETQQPVTDDTLFELGSISKTFTATLAAYAQAKGVVSLTDAASKHLPSLRGSSFDRISLLQLGTHTAGGLPLQVPENVKNNEELIAYLQHWQPTYAAGTRRVYSNVGIGLLGMISAAVLHRTFEDAVEKELLPALGMTRSYLRVPADQMGSYAQGYTPDDQPIRVAPGVLDAEAYGLKATASDLARFLTANLEATSPGSGGKEEGWRRALSDTHTAYFTAGELTQDLIWEQYPYPVELRRVLAGNSSAMITGATAATKLPEPLPSQTEVLINKTGSTNGFATYIVFIPGKKLGVVLLANKRYDIEARVTAAFEILTRLDSRSAALDQAVVPGNKAFPEIAVGSGQKLIPEMVVARVSPLR